jgi:hypothetical protein
MRRYHVVLSSGKFFGWTETQISMLHIRGIQAKWIQLLTSALWLSLIAPSVLAHNFWIEPQTFRPAPGAAVS